jgi:hypothetical protein
MTLMKIIIAIGFTTLFRLCLIHTPLTIRVMMQTTRRSFPKEAEPLRNYDDVTSHTSFMIILIKFRVYSCYIVSRTGSIVLI